MARNKSNYIYNNGTTPETRVAISQKNRVFSKPYSSNSSSIQQIGVLSTFGYQESRAVDPVRGVGFGDKIQELVPGITDAMSLTLNRTLLYTSGLFQELGYKGGIDGLVRSLRHHRWPFDIRNELVFSELVMKDTADLSGYHEQATQVGGTSATAFALITQFVGCWLESYDISYASDSAIVAENCGARATDITDGKTPYENGSPDNYGDSMNSGNAYTGASGTGSALYA